jgi:hypothetical protein
VFQYIYIKEQFFYLGKKILFNKKIKILAKKNLTKIHGKEEGLRRKEKEYEKRKEEDKKKRRTKRRKRGTKESCFSACFHRLVNTLPTPEGLRSELLHKLTLAFLQRTRIVLLQEKEARE